MPNGDQAVQAPQANLSETKAKLTDLFSSIEGVYDKLRKAGETQAAFQLREASTRYARAGSQLGLNAFARARALEDLKSGIVSAARQAGAREEASKLNAKLETLGRIGALQAEEFNQAMQGATLEASERSRLWRQSFSEAGLAEQQRQFGVQTGLQREQLEQQESQFARRLEEQRAGREFGEERILRQERLDEEAQEQARREGLSLRARDQIREAVARTQPSGFLFRDPRTGVISRTRRGPIGTGVRATLRGRPIEPIQGGVFVPPGERLAAGAGSTAIAALTGRLQAAQPFAARAAGTPEQAARRILALHG